MEISTNGNQLLQFNAPWKTIKENPEQVKVVMNLLNQYLYALSICIRPFLPFTSDNLRALLNVDNLTESGELTALCNQLAEGEVPLSAGHKISEPKHLFSRIEDDIIAAQVEKLKQTKKEATPTAAGTPVSAPIKDTINYDDFAKMDLRTATVIEAQKVPKTDKLLQLTLDLGF